MAPSEGDAVSWEGLCYQPILNFLQKSLELGIEDDTMKKFAFEFFSVESVVNAKKLLWSRIFPTEVPPRRSSTTPVNNISDLLDAFRRCEREQIELPDFVIRYPSEVPVIPAVAYTRLSSQLTSCVQDIRYIAERIGTLDLSLGLRQASPVSVTQVPDMPVCHSVVVDNVPESICDHSSRTQFFDGLEGRDGITNVKANSNKSRLIVQTSNATYAEVLAKSIAKELPPGTTARVVSRKYYGVVRSVPQTISADDLRSMVPGATEVSPISDSRSFKIGFLDQAALISALSSGVKIGYELFRIHEFHRMPRRCYRCQSPAHVIANCPLDADAPKCARCSGCHTYNKESPCTAKPKCANCGKGHVAFSLRCEVLRRVLQPSYDG